MILGLQVAVAFRLAWCAACRSAECIGAPHCCHCVAWRGLLLRPIAVRKYKSHGARLAGRVLPAPLLSLALLADTPHEAFVHCFLIYHPHGALQAFTSAGEASRQSGSGRHIGPFQALQAANPQVVRFDPADGSIVQQGAPEIQDATADDAMWHGADSDDFATMGVPSPPPSPVIHMQKLQVEDAPEQWLQRSLESGETPCVHVLEYTEEAEVVLTMPRYNAAMRKLGREVNAANGAHHLARTNPMAFVRIRRISLEDRDVMVNTCDNPGCDRTPADDEHVRSIMLAPESVWPYEQLFAHVEPLCRCARVAVAITFGVLGSGPGDAGSMWAWHTNQLPFGAHGRYSGLCPRLACGAKRCMPHSLHLSMIEAHADAWRVALQEH